MTSTSRLAGIGAPLLAVLLACPATAQIRVSDKERAAFSKLVKEYRGYVVPHCAPEMVGAYTSFNMGRDAAFVESLRGTPLESVYIDAVTEKREQDARTVFECGGPPPPPPAPGVVPSAIDRRSAAIKAAQARFEEQARDLPSYFDKADSVFARLVALRDQVLARAEH